jgi:outer membrane lipoprotein-sorting protein
MRYELARAAAVIAILAVALGFAPPVQAGTCQPVRAKGVAKDMATATTYAQADLTQTAKSMRGKVTQASTNCVPGPNKYSCKIDAVVCPK